MALSQVGAYKVALADAGTAGGVLAIENTSGLDRIVTQVILDVTTQSTAAATVDVGIAADGTTSNAQLMDGIAVGAAGTFDMLTNAVAGTGPNRWDDGEFLTISEASGDVADLAGYAYIQWIVIG